MNYYHEYREPIYEETVHVTRWTDHDLFTGFLILVIVILVMRGRDKS